MFGQNIKNCKILSAAKQNEKQNSTSITKNGGKIILQLLCLDYSGGC